MSGRHVGVVAQLPAPWLDRLVALGARPGCPREGWGPVLKVGSSGAVATLDLDGPAFEHLAAHLAGTGTGTGGTAHPVWTVGDGGWRALDVSGMGADEVARALSDRLDAPGEGRA